MLSHLSIKNFALIDELSVSFSDGFSIITGETGAGKTILLGGLGLILGKRADVSSINDTSKKCIVEAEFNISKYKIKSIFKELDLDYDDNSVIRREISPSGKSRAFINDSPVSLQVLKTLSSYLIDIHSQNQTLDLTSDDFQFQIIDALSNNDKLIIKYTNELQEFNSLQKELNSLSELQKNSLQSHDYNTFLLNELLEAKLDDISLEELEQELEQLSNIEEIQERLSLSNQVLSDEQIGVITLINQVKTNLKSIESYSGDYASFYNRISSVSIELDDLLSEIENTQESIEYNPNRLSELTDNINLLHNLLKKHQVSTIEELIQIRNELDVSVGKLDNLDEDIQSKTFEIGSQKEVILKLAKQISDNRVQAIPKLIKQLEKILVNLGMENASFQIEVSQQDSFFVNGIDKLSFLFSANKGGNYNELKKAASGGELSRIMLAVKAILSKYKQLPTIMFDEIDTGVSGDIANKMGMLMEYMSQNMQVFSITHLPQIASKGHEHFKVFKEDVKNITKSNLKQLDTDERVIEIAEMLGGKTLTDSALNHAKELLNMKA